MATSPGGVISIDNETFGVIELLSTTKTLTCRDSAFCLIICDGQIMLNRKHDYYYQVTSQIALTDGEFCDFAVWTEVDIATH